MPDPVLVVKEPADPITAQKIAAETQAKELEEKFAKLDERLTGQSKYIAKLEKELETVKKPKEEKVVADPLSERVKSLEAKQTMIDAREKTQREREVLASLERSLVDAGVESARAKREAKLLAMEHKDHITVDDEMNVTMADGDKVVAIPEWVNAFMQTDEGKSALPTKRNPTSDALTGRTSGGVTGKPKVTMEDLRMGRVSTKDIREGKVQVVGAKF